MKKMGMAGPWATQPGFRWSVGRGLLWVSMFIAKAALHILPVPKGTTRTCIYRVPEEEEKNDSPIM